MLNLIIAVLRLFIQFLQATLALLEQQQAHPAQPPQDTPVLAIQDTPDSRDTPDDRQPETPAESATVTDDTHTDPGTETLEALSAAYPVTPRTPTRTAPRPSPASPSAFRDPPVSNTALYAEYLTTKICGHYCHAATRSVLQICPVCRENPPRRH